MNTRLFLIGMPKDDLAKCVGNDAVETTIRTVENELELVVDRVIPLCARMTFSDVVLTNRKNRIQRAEQALKVC